MAIIHYTGYCPKCRKYQTKDKICTKCGDVLKRCSKWLETYRAAENGKIIQKKSKMYDRKSDLDQARALRITSFNSKTSADITFEYLAQKYLDNLLEYKKESSYVTNESRIRARLYPFLQNSMLKNITIENLEDIKKSLNSYSDGYKATLWGLLSILFNFAARKFDIAEPLMVFKKIEPYRPPKPQKAYWTISEWEKFISTIEELSEKEANKKIALNHFKYLVLFNFLYYNGNRKGEATATKVKHLHLDVEHPYCETVENISYKIIKEKRKKGITYNTTSPKTGERLVKIPPKLTELLKKYIAVFNLDEEDYLFFKSSPIPPQTLRNRMDEYIEVANVKRLTPHKFRNSIASRIFSTGDNKIAAAYATAKRLGNNIKYALETYGELFDEEEDKLLEKLNS